MRHRGRAGSGMLAVALLATTVGFDVTVGAASVGEDPVPFVIGGSDDLNPGYVAVLLRPQLSDPQDANFCAGSLIRVDIVMTAAHCVDDLDPANLDVAVGATLLSSIDPEDRRDVMDIAIHPDWVVDAVLPTDIALLRLVEPTGGLAVVPIEQDPVEPSLLRPLEVVGWGYADPFRTVSLDPLQSANSLAITDVETSVGTGSDLCLLDDPTDDFCYGTATTGTCQGDSGGPILAETSVGSGEMEVVGIVSFGPASRCLHPTYFDGGQRVSPYLEWINTNLASWNEPPEVTVDQEQVTVQEGEVAGTTGVFSDRELLDVTISASVGNISQETGGSGTWSWSYPTSDGPADTQTVTITAFDGTIATTSFELIVENVAPSISASAQTVRDGGTFEAAIFEDAGVADAHTATIDWGEGGGPQPATAIGTAGAGSVEGSNDFASTGEHTITACVTDHDGAQSCDLATLVVIADLVCPDPVLPFGDVPVSSFALGDIGCIFGLGITTGTSSSTFDPFGYVTREQMAAFVARLIRALQLI